MFDPEHNQYEEYTYRPPEITPPPEEMYRAEEQSYAQEYQTQEEIYTPRGEAERKQAEGKENKSEKSRRQQSAGSGGMQAIQMVTMTVASLAVVTVAAATSGGAFLPELGQMATQAYEAVAAMPVSVPGPRMDVQEILLAFGGQTVTVDVPTDPNGSGGENGGGEGGGNQSNGSGETNGGPGVATPSQTQSPEPTQEPDPEPTPEPSPESTPEPSPSQSSRPGPFPRPSATPKPTPTTPDVAPDVPVPPQPTPTPEPTPTPTPTPSVTPTETPTPPPSETPEPPPSEKPKPPSHSHSYAESITTPATCTVDGVKTYTCGCGSSYTEPIPATGNHAYDAGTVTTDATCAVAGVKTYTCTVCSGSNTEPIPATGVHIWDGGTVTTPATCTVDGVKTFACTTCPSGSAVTRTEDIPPIGATLTVYEPLTITSGFNADVVVEVSDTDLWNKATGYDDDDRSAGSAAFFSQEYSNSAGQLPLPPNSGDRMITNPVVGGHRYKLADYTGSNSVQLNTSTPGATIAVTAAKGYDRLSFLGSSGNADGVVEAIVTYTDGTVSTAETLSFPHWVYLNGQDVARKQIVGLSRVILKDKIIQTEVNANINAFALFYAEIEVDPAKTVTSIALEFQRGAAWPNILAVSGVAGADGAHAWTEAITTPADCVTLGVKTLTCTNCAVSRTEPIPATGHTDGPAQDNVDGTHTVKCATCNVAIKTVAHTIAYERPPVDGEDMDFHVRKCTVCAFSVKEAHVSDTYFNEGDKHIRRCACEFDLVGTGVPHTYVYTDQGDGTHVGTCVCGATQAAQAHTLTTATNNPGDSLLHDGTCTVCNQYVSMPHVPGDTWQSEGASFHSHKCTVCSTSTDSAPHTGYESIDAAQHKVNCPDCGYVATENHTFRDGACIRCSEPDSATVPTTPPAVYVPTVSSTNSVNITALNTFSMRITAGWTKGSDTGTMVFALMKDGTELERLSATPQASGPDLLDVTKPLTGLTDSVACTYTLLPICIYGGVEYPQTAQAAEISFTPHEVAPSDFAATYAASALSYEPLPFGGSGTAQQLGLVKDGASISSDVLGAPAILQNPAAGSYHFVYRVTFDGVTYLLQSTAVTVP